jgi:hypothetical protein
MNYLGAAERVTLQDEPCLADRPQVINRSVDIMDALIKYLKATTAKLCAFVQVAQFVLLPE